MDCFLGCPMSLGTGQRSEAVSNNVRRRQPGVLAGGPGRLSSLETPSKSGFGMAGQGHALLRPAKDLWKASRVG